jgi:hypothetical protein
MPNVTRMTMTAKRVSVECVGVDTVCRESGLGWTGAGGDTDRCTGAEGDRGGAEMGGGGTEGEG